MTYLRKIAADLQQLCADFDADFKNKRPTIARVAKLKKQLLKITNEVVSAASSSAHRNTKINV